MGRLATYRYYNMDQVVGQALATFNRVQEQLAMQAGAPTSASALSNKADPVHVAKMRQLKEQSSV